MNKCAVSIPSNIAKRSGRESKKEFNHFLSISLGSSFELETQLIISLELKYITQQEFESVDNQLQEIQKKMVYGLKKTLT